MKFWNSVMKPEKKYFSFKANILKSILNSPTGSFWDSAVVELPMVRIFDNWIFWPFDLVDLLDERPKGGLDTELVLEVSRFNHLGKTVS